MRLGVLGIVLLLLGGGAVAIGLLPTADAVALGERVWPVLLFAFAATVVAELASQAGVFDEVASRLALLARGRTIVLWLFVVVMAVGFTAFLSLDTTAVLLTPVVVLIAVQARLRARVFALTTVWLANTASLWLPVSNLTNLLALHTLGGGGAGAFLRLMWAPALVAWSSSCCPSSSSRVPGRGSPPRWRPLRWSHSSRGADRGRCVRASCRSR